MMKNRIVPISKEVTEETHKPLIIIDGESGEIIRTIYKRRDNKQYKPIIYDSSNPEFNLPLIPWRDNNMFIKLYSNEELPEYDSEKFLIYWLKLTKKLSFGTNIISRKTRDKGFVPLSESEMIKLLDISERTFRDFMKESIAKYYIVKDVITDGKGERINYVMNPIYMFNGSNINMYTYELFKNDKKLQDTLTVKFKQRVAELYDIVNETKKRENATKTQEVINQIIYEKKNLEDKI